MAMIIPKKKCILISFFNSNNLGDLILSNIIYKKLSVYYEVIKCSTGGSFHIQDSKVTEIAPWKRKLARLGSTFIRHADSEDNKSLDEYVRMLDLVDFVVLAGGNMLMELSDRDDNCAKLRRYIQAAREKKKKGFILFVGAGPFCNESQKESAICLINECEYVSFRDRHSYLLFENRLKIPYEITCDPAFLYQPGSNTIQEEKCIALNIMNFRLLQTKEYKVLEKAYHELIQALIREFSYPIVLFSTEKNDYEAIRKIYSKYKTDDKILLADISSIEELDNLYAKTVLVIGTRMHAMIIAYASVIPVIGLSWQKKVQSFFEIIERPWVYDIANMRENISEIISAVRVCLADLSEEKKYLLIKLEQIRSSIQDSFDNAHIVIERKYSDAN